MIECQEPDFASRQFLESSAGLRKPANDTLPAKQSGTTIPSGAWPFRSAAKRGRKSRVHVWQKPAAVFAPFLRWPIRRTQIDPAATAASALPLFQRASNALADQWCNIREAWCSCFCSG